MIDQTTSRPDRPLELFISTSEADSDLEMLDRLEKHLSMLTLTGVITAWHRGRIAPGTERARVIDERLSRAQVILLLVSPDYVAQLMGDDAELSRAMARHASGEARVVPILLSPANWEALPFAKLQVLPKDLKPVSEHRDKERVFQRIARGIDEAIQDFLERRPERPTGATRYQNVPRSGVRSFVGRSSALEQLHALLRAHDRVSIAAITGMGGLGKSELALQYALEQLRRGGYPGGICWLKARGLDLHGQLLIFARDTLKMTVPDGLEPADRIRYLFRNWPEGEVLLVFDDVTGLEPLLPYLPENAPRFRVLITTRQDRLSPHFQQLGLDVLEEAPALELLGALAGEARVQEELEVARALCLELGYLPLGLELAGRYLWRKPDLSLGELLERLRVKGLEQKALREADPDMTAPLGVEAAFELSWEAVRQARARELACLLSVFALAPIPWSLVEACLPETDSEDLEDWRDELVGLHLVKRRERGSYELHPLVHRWLRGKLAKAANGEALKRGFCRVIAVRARGVQQDMTQEQVKVLAPLKPHLGEAASTWFAELEDECLLSPFEALVKYLSSQGLFKEAERWAQAGYEICMARLGTENEHVAMSMNNLALLYQSQGRYKDAEPPLRQVLDLRRRLLGEAHPDVASSLNNLAMLYQSQGRYEDAEPLLRQALDLYRRLLGEAHPDVAMSLNNLAALYQSQGRYEDAEPLFRQALDLYRRLLGEAHPHVAGSQNNLALLYRSQGRYEDAESLFRQALDLYRQLLGEAHPDVAGSMSNLAALYQSQGRYEDAEPLYRQALDLFRRLLGEAHPHVAMSLNNLASLYQAQGRYEDAEPLFRQALDLYRQLLGEAHPAVATILNNLAMLYQSQGRYEDAEPLYRQALDLLRRLLGEAHPDVATSLNNLAMLLQSQGRYEDAEPLLRQALDRRRRLFGEAHPEVASSLNNLAMLYQSQGRYEDAEPLLRQALDLCRRLLGEAHPDVTSSLHNLAMLYQSQGRYEDAEPLFKRALSIRHTKLGRKHPYTIQTGKWLAYVQAEIAKKRASAPPSPPRPGRNEPCWCGSGVKYKKCHLPTEP